MHRPRQLLWWLALALLLAPALGRIHQVVHPAGAPGHAQGLQARAGEAAPVQGAGGSWLLALFAGHSHSDCPLHDQLNAWAGPPVGGQPLHHGLPPALLPPVQERTASAGSAAFFDPRAPPAAAA